MGGAGLTSCRLRSSGGQLDQVLSPSDSLLGSPISGLVVGCRTARGDVFMLGAISCCMVSSKSPSACSRGGQSVSGLVTGCCTTGSDVLTSLAPKAIGCRI